jgi:hypothetical protein
MGLKMGEWAGEYLNAESFAGVLAAHGLPRGDALVVTIRRVELRELFVPDRNERKKAPVLFFDELRPGLVATKPIVRPLLGMLGSDDSDDWIGARIALVLVEDAVAPRERGGPRRAAIRVRPAPAAPSPQDRRDARGRDEEGQERRAIANGTKVGPERAKAISDELRALCRSSDALLGFIRSKSLDAWEACTGKCIGDWPEAALPYARDFVREQRSRPTQDPPPASR